MNEATSDFCGPGTPDFPTETFGLEISQKNGLLAPFLFSFKEIEEEQV